MVLVISVGILLLLYFNDNQSKIPLTPTTPPTNTPAPIDPPPVPKPPTTNPINPQPPDQPQPIDNTPPEIQFEFSKQAQTLDVSSNHSDINLSSWRYAKFSSKPSCNSTIGNQLNLQPPQNSRLELISSDNDQYFCFKVDDYSGNTGFASYYIQGISSQSVISDTTPPIIEIEQINNVLTALANEVVNAQSWSYVFYNDNLTCNASRFENQVVHQGSNLSLSTAHINYYFCFKVEDRVANIGYARHRVIAWSVPDTTAPIINLNLNSNHVLTISSPADDLVPSSWGYAKFNQRPACNASNINVLTVQVPASRRLQLSYSDNNKYLCFKVEDQSGNRGFELYLISNIPQPTNPNQPTPQRPAVDNTAPSINISQTDDRLTASASDASGIDTSSWRYVSSSSSFSCNASAFSGRTVSTGKTVALDQSQVGHYFCFKIDDTVDNTGYGFKRVIAWTVADKTPPTISFSYQSSSKVLTISSADSDVNANSWRYAKFSSNPNCSASIKSQLTSSLPSNLKLQLTSADSKLYICVTVADTSGNDGYNEHRVATITPPTPVSTTATQSEANQALGQLISWWNSPPDLGYELIKYPVREVYMKDTRMGGKLARANWLNDGINTMESDVAYGLSHLVDYDLSQSPRTNLADQMLAHSIRTPLRTHRINALKSLGWIKFNNLTKFKRIIQQSWFTDGLNEEELAYMSVFEYNLNTTTLFANLLTRHYTKKKTINLPYSGSTTIWLFKPKPFANNDPALRHIENGLRGPEHLFKSGLHLTDVPILLVDASNYPSEVLAGGVNFVDTTYIFRGDSSAAGLIYHELSHFYFVGQLNEEVLWLTEGGANFTTIYINAWLDAGGGNNWPESVTASEATYQYCVGQSRSQITDLTVNPGTCIYALGQYVVSRIFNTIGESAFRSALQEMRSNYLDYDYYRQPGIRDEGQTDEQIYQIFLKHTPTNKKQAFKDLYKQLHGGSFVK